MPLGPFDWTGGPFLALYGGLLAVAILAAILIPKRLRPDGGGRAPTDPDELAYLSGGRPRLTDAIIARLLALGQLAAPVGGRFALASTPPRPLGGLTGDQTYAAIDRALRPTADAVATRLTRAGLLMDAGSALRLRLWGAAPFVALLLFGAIKWDVGVSRDRPVGYLSILMILTAVFAVLRFAALDRRTRGGLAAVRDARRQHERLDRAPRDEETALAVALFGTGVLATTAYAGFHRMRSSDASAASGGGSSDGGGDGGGGGGGCGGCGS